jgi:hypothetical protein
MIYLPNQFQKALGSFVKLKMLFHCTPSPHLLLVNIIYFNFLFSTLSTQFHHQFFAGFVTSVTALCVEHPLSLLSMGHLKCGWFSVCRQQTCTALLLWCLSPPRITISMTNFSFLGFSCLPFPQVIVL